MNVVSKEGERLDGREMYLALCLPGRMGESVVTSFVSTDLEEGAFFRIQLSFGLLKEKEEPPANIMIWSSDGKTWKGLALIAEGQTALPVLISVLSKSCTQLMVRSKDG